MKQQLIERLNNLKNRTDRDYEFAWESQKSYDKWQIDILEEIQALWDGWIPVTERLHKPLINHIVWHHDWMTLWAYHDWVWYWDSLQHLYNVTHWMPLPLPPQINLK